MPTSKHENLIVYFGSITNMLYPVLVQKYRHKDAEFFMNTESTELTDLRSLLSCEKLSYLLYFPCFKKLSVFAPLRLKETLLLAQLINLFLESFHIYIVIQPKFYHVSILVKETECRNPHLSYIILHGIELPGLKGYSATQLREMRLFMKPDRYLILIRQPWLTNY